jgi:hypothetical protein
MGVTTAPVSGTELLVGGEVTTPDGVPVADALITAFGSRVRTDAEGSFEVLAIGPAAAAERVAVSVAAPGHRPLSTELDLAAARTARLTDGTVVVMHDFVLTPAGDIR